MGSVLNLLFEKWIDGKPIPNGESFGCGFPYCSDYIDTNYLKVNEVDENENVFFPISINHNFFSIFSDNFFSFHILNLIYNKKIKVLILREHEGGGNHDEFFKKLNEFILKNNLNHSSFYIYFANKNLKQHYRNALGEIGLNVSVSDWLIEHTSLVVNKSLQNRSINDLGYNFELIDYKKQVDRKYNFLCLNRVPKAHRVSFLARLYKSKSLFDIDWSMLFSPYEFSVLYGEEKDEFGKNIFSIEHFSRYFDRNDLMNHEKELKYIFYTKKKSQYEPISKSLFNFFGDTKTTHFRETYENSYCSLITETSFENNEEHITEKSLKPFINLHLGIFLSPYKHLERLKMYGFETFSKFWDEGYDDIVDPKDRMVEICGVIDGLNSDKLKHIYESAEDILIHNQNVFLDLWKRESCKKYFKSLINGE